MTNEELIAHGNHFRSISEPEKAIACYAQAFVQNHNDINAFNNYGNVIREMGFPERAIPFLLNAIAINPEHITAQFNLAVAYLLMGDYEKGFEQYEYRWKYEHLNGLLPKFDAPRWNGEDLAGKTILVCGEQGHGDNIQFCRFAEQLVAKGAKVIINVDDNLAALLRVSILGPTQIVSIGQPLPTFDYWTPIMSIPRLLGITLKNLPHKMQYLTPSRSTTKAWSERLGLKRKLRVGFAWSGRRDSWINQHKAIPFEKMLELIKKNPDYEWFNLQIDCSEDEARQLAEAGVRMFPGAIQSWDDTAGLVAMMDVVISVDTSVGHLAGALGRPFWLPLNQFGQDWRWLLGRNDSPWYASCRIFRQPKIGDWDTPLDVIHNHLKLFKI